MSNLYGYDHVWETTHSPIEYSKREAVSYIYDHLGNQRLIYPKKQEDIPKDKTGTSVEVVSEVF